MGKIKVHEFISLDGVYESPSWTAEYPWDPKMGDAIGALTGSARALLLGRKTYEMFAPAWSSRSADDPGVTFFNESEKLVVSSGDNESIWNNTTFVGGYDADRVRDLKESDEGDLYVSGSGTLVRAMLTDGLVDELHLFVFPVALGEGDRLFDGAELTKLTLLETEAYDSGVVHLSYGPA